jgi:site-specific recombinase XerD
MKIYSNLAINYWLRAPKNQSNSKLKSVYCRIIVNNERIDISTNIKVATKDWCTLTERIKSTNGYEVNSNSYLDEMSSHYIEAYNQLRQENKPISLASLKSRYNRNQNQESAFNSTNSIKYICEKFLETVEIQLASNILTPSTRRAYKCTAKTFQSFLPTVGLSPNSTPEELNRITFMEFEKYLITVRNQNSNSAYRVIKQLRRIFNFAYENDILAQRIEIKSNLRYRNPERKFLTIEEVNAIESYPFNDETLSEVRDVFMFSVYTGFAFNELYSLTRKNIKEIEGRTWISITRKKTGNEQKVPLLPIPLSIIKKYENHPKCVRKAKLLPIRNNICYNRLLKDIQTELNIETKITSHIGRHTFATTIALCNGLSIETLSKILSHTSIKVTQIYAKVVDSKVIEDFDKLKYALNTRINRGEVSVGA